MKLFDRIGLRPQTFSNFARMLKNGQLDELPKVAYRRTAHLFKFIKRVLSAVFGVYYHHPAVQKRRHHKQLKHLLARYYSFDEYSEGKLKVALIAEGATTYPFSSFFIRLVSPLTDPKLKKKISLSLLPENSIAVPEGTKVCIVQRTAFDDIELAKQLVLNLKTSKCALVIDSDDAFHIIDKNHPEHSIHSNRLAAFDFLLSKASQVWLSTPRMVESLKPYSRRKPKLVENTLDPRLWSNLLKAPAANKGKLRFVYMGTVSHEADLALIMPALKNLATKYPNSFSLDVMGVTPDSIEYPWAKRIFQKHNGSIYPRFVRWFQDQGPYDVGLAPLVDTEFNRNKSDIKALDYLAAGIVPMVSDVEAYKTPDLASMIIKVGNSKEAWERSLESIIQNHDEFRIDAQKKLKLAQKYILTKRSSSVTALKLYDLLIARSV